MTLHRERFVPHCPGRVVESATLQIGVFVGSRDAPIGIVNGTTRDVVQVISGILAESNLDQKGPWCARAREPKVAGSVEGEQKRNTEDLVDDVPRGPKHTDDTAREALTRDLVEEPTRGDALRLGAARHDLTPTLTDSRLVAVVVVHSVTVRPRTPPPPAANITAAFDFTIDGTIVRFVDRSMADADAPIPKWSWCFGDGTVSSERSPTHTYSVPGFTAAYDVNLAVCDAEGACDSTARLITFYNVLYNLPLSASVVVAAVGLVFPLLALLLHRHREEPKKASMPMQHES